MTPIECWELFQNLPQDKQERAIRFALEDNLSNFEWFESLPKTEQKELIKKAIKNPFSLSEIVSIERSNKEFLKMLQIS